MSPLHPVVLAALGSSLAAFACGQPSSVPSPEAPEQNRTSGSELAPASVDELIRAALDDPRKGVERAPELRSHGPEALQRLLAEAERRNQLGPELDPLIDRVAGQRYARHARLFWHTDLEGALAQARAEDKPVLSLRLLGQLTEDLSCANSRFFRVVLYPDPAVQKLLAERFVLHWSSERPAPKVTVDYGDGRKLVRTITGNSVHYVLDRRGRVLDAVPGLQDPAAFHGALFEAAKLARLGELDDAAFAEALRVHHGEAADAVLDDWRRRLEAVGIEVPPQRPRLGREPRVSALLAAQVAASKALVEMPLVVPLTAPEDVEGKTDGAVWEKLGAQRRPGTRLSEEARRLVRELLPRVVAEDGSLVPLAADALEALVDRFEKVLAVDTEKNRLLLARRIHERLRERPLEGFESFNRWVYGSLFLTPREDPWLGLVEPGGFSALPSEGLEAPPNPR